MVQPKKLCWKSLISTSSQTALLDKSTHTPALHVLAGEMPLDIRKTQLMTNYWANLKGREEQHHSKVVLQECWEQGRGQRASFGWACKKYAEDLGVINIKLSVTVVIPKAEAWTHSTPLIDMELLVLRKSERGTVNRVSVLVIEHYSQSVQKYADRSKAPEHQTPGATFSVPERKSIGIECIPNNLGNCSVLSALWTLHRIEENKPGNTLIFSGSVSVLKSLKSLISCCQDNLFKVLQVRSRLTQQGMSILFIWVPAHAGLKGIEEADRLAKQALQRDAVDLQAPLSTSQVKGIAWSKAAEEWPEQ